MMLNKGIRNVAKTIPPIFNFKKISRGAGLRVPGRHLPSAQVPGGLAHCAMAGAALTLIYETCQPGR
jgi:hypothetical protein